MYHNIHTKYYCLKHIIRIYTLGPIRIFHLFKMLGYEEGKKKKKDKETYKQMLIYVQPSSLSQGMMHA